MGIRTSSGDKLILYYSLRKDDHQFNSDVWEYFYVGGEDSSSGVVHHSDELLSNGINQCSELNLNNNKEFQNMYQQCHLSNSSKLNKLKNDLFVEMRREGFEFIPSAIKTNVQSDSNKKNNHKHKKSKKQDIDNHKNKDENNNNGTTTTMNNDGAKMIEVKITEVHWRGRSEDVLASMILPLPCRSIPFDTDAFMKCLNSDHIVKMSHLVGSKQYASSGGGGGGRNNDDVNEVRQVGTGSKLMVNGDLMKSSSSSSVAASSFGSLLLRGEHNSKKVLNIQSSQPAATAIKKKGRTTVKEISPKQSYKEKMSKLAEENVNKASQSSTSRQEAVKFVNNYRKELKEKRKQQSKQQLERANSGMADDDVKDVKDVKDSETDSSIANSIINNQEEELRQQQQQQNKKRSMTGKKAVLATIKEARARAQLHSGMQREVGHEEKGEEEELGY
jgi:hypothetical protein